MGHNALLISNHYLVRLCSGYHRPVVNVGAQFLTKAVVCPVDWPRIGVGLLPQVCPV